MKIELLETLRNKISLYQEAKKQRQLKELENKKNDVLSFIESPMSEEEIVCWNSAMLINSAGWLGGNYTETDIKLRCLGENSHLFSIDEIIVLQKRITEQKDLTIKK